MRSTFAPERPPPPPRIDGLICAAASKRLRAATLAADGELMLATGVVAAVVSVATGRSISIGDASSLSSVADTTTALAPLDGGVACVRNCASW
jgi:hypothetical protein